MLETANFTASLNNDAYIDIDVLPGLPWRMVVIKELFWNSLMVIWAIFISFYV